MNKAQLIEQMANATGLTKVQAGKALNSFTSSVISSLKKGDKVSLLGFGTFIVSQRSARNGRNPQTGEIIKIKATRVPKFKAGKDFSGKIAKAAKK